jgi:hypothetical protein
MSLSEAKYSLIIHEHGAGHVLACSSYQRVVHRSALASPSIQGGKLPEIIHFTGGRHPPITEGEVDMVDPYTAVSSELQTVGICCGKLSDIPNLVACWAGSGATDSRRIQAQRNRSISR